MVDPRRKSASLVWGSSPTKNWGRRRISNARIWVLLSQQVTNQQANCFTDPEGPGCHGCTTALTCNRTLTQDGWKTLNPTDTFRHSLAPEIQTMEWVLGIKSRPYENPGIINPSIIEQVHWEAISH